MTSYPHFGPLRSAMPVPAAGAGLKPEHADDILEGARRVDFFEIHAENYMGAGGPPHHLLHRIRADYPLSIHGVGLSIGGAAPLDRDASQAVETPGRDLSAGAVLRASRLVHA